MTSATSATKTPRTASATDIAVGQRIRIARINKGMSQTQLGRAVGVSFQQLQKYEKGVNRVGAGRLRLISEKLDVPIGAFFSDASAESGGDLQMPLDLLVDHRTIRLLKAFNRLSDGQLKQAILNLVELSAEARQFVEIAAPADLPLASVHAG